MWRRVVWLFTNNSEEITASIFKVEKYAKQ
jgi:hypothetical protein